FDVIMSGGDMTVTLQPAATIAGTVISPHPTVTLLDDNEDPISDVDITVSLNQGSFNSGTLTVSTGVDGIAVFSNLVINAADEDYEIKFTADMSGVADAFTNEFDVIAAAAATMSVFTQP